MRITRIDIETTTGQATLTRDGHVGRPQIRVRGWAGPTTRTPFSDWAYADADGIAGLARRLQLKLAGDGADYRTLLERMT